MGITRNAIMSINMDNLDLFVVMVPYVDDIAIFINNKAFPICGCQGILKRSVFKLHDGIIAFAIEVSTEIQISIVPI